MTDIVLNKAHFPVETLGYGRRVGLWLQGCSLGCEGCISRDTWDPAAGQTVPVEAVVDWVLQRHERGADGLTVSGGEPFQQPEALADLLDRIAAGVDRTRFDILVYSGYSLRFLEKRHASLLGLCDAVVSEPFVAATGPGDALRGSANQHLVARTALGRLRYAETSARPTGRSIQVAIEQDAIWYIGIPGPGDMERLERFAAVRNIDLREGTWLT